MCLNNPVWTLKLIRESYPEYHITSSTDAFEFIKANLFPTLIEKSHEVFYFIGLNTSNQIIIVDEHSRGGVNESRVYIAEIAKRLLLANCSQVILIHNHPSGKLRPSDSDIDLTYKTQEALKLFEIKVLDHLVVGLSVSDFLSFKETGII